MSFTLNNVLVVSAVSFLGLLCVLVYIVKMKNEQDNLNMQIINKIKSLSEVNKQNIVTIKDLQNLSQRLSHETNKIKGRVSRGGAQELNMRNARPANPRIVELEDTEDSDRVEEDLYEEEEEDEIIAMRAVEML
jgi:predicted  nucleic acid-binding Zn-ribbon protein